MKEIAANNGLKDDKKKQIDCLCKAGELIYSNCMHNKYLLN